MIATAATAPVQIEFRETRDLSSDSVEDTDLAEGTGKTWYAVEDGLIRLPTYLDELGGSLSTEVEVLAPLESREPAALSAEGRTDISGYGNCEPLATAAAIQPGRALYEHMLAFVESVSDGVDPAPLSR